MLDVFYFGADVDIAKTEEIVAAGGAANVVVHMPGPVAGGTPRSFQISFCLAGKQQMANAVPVGIPSFVPPSTRRMEHEADARPISRNSLDHMKHFESALWLGVLVPLVQKEFDQIGFVSRAPKRLCCDDNKVGASSPPFALLPPPTHLESLKFGALLGQGSFGRVYRGELYGSPVAVKVLEMPRNDEELRRQAVAEGALSRRLAHPNVVPTLDFLIHDPDESSGDGADTESPAVSDFLQVWIIQHLCNKGSLYTAIERGWFRETRSLSAGPDLGAVLETAMEIASALQYLHEQGVQHGDLSGNNVLLTSHPGERGFTALVTDFGQSRVSNDDVSTRTTGTVSHMPPELLMDGLLTTAADVYAFGVLLWEMYCGQRAWAGSNMAQIIFKVTIRGECLVLPPEAPEELKSLTSWCMAMEPSQRPAFDEVIVQLKDMQAALT